MASQKYPSPSYESITHNSLTYQMEPDMVAGLKAADNAVRRTIIKKLYNQLPLFRDAVRAAFLVEGQTSTLDR